ncbi:MAG: serine/threonine protein kinase, partial [Deltaproteobacteria bacterium]|nr:serine/threonine protein kinase [Deltaproteobacteria bacterium]
MTTANAPKTQLGRYQLVRHLASGGMADLWLARATGIEGFERHVAIKRIRKEQARDQRFVQMFLDEARLAASLHHNNIATVHDIGQTQGEYFFAMEWVHGEDLRKILMHASAREQYLPIEHVMTIVLAATAALHYAHEHKSQIVHRDVSPANIIVGYDGNVKVVDFGIAKAAHRGKETQSGAMKGKVAYMSPEQCVGQPVDRRSDIFSLGIVLYELVTVRRLFKAANDFLTMSAIIHGDIPPPSIIRPGLPRELEAIIMKALAHERDDRFRTAEEMRAVLERFCTANHIRTSSTVLADYMRAMFGQKPEPWLVDAAEELEVSIDFDGTASGIVRVPEAALKRHAMPSST